MTTSPTQRSLAECKARGWVAGVVEKWVVRPAEKHRWRGGKPLFELVVKNDLWGWCDIVALDPYTGDLYFIQCTSGTNHAARVSKTAAWEHLSGLQKNPAARAVVWSWSKRVAYRKDGTKAVRPRWTLRETDLRAVCAHE